MSYYGIDLGTTNSLIGRQVPEFLSDIVPSCVDPKTNKAGKDVYENLNAIRSFKIDMSLGIEGQLSIQASRRVLEELKRQVKDDDVKDVLISVPAYFSDNQRQATIEAAKLAKLNVIGLINEPTAAAAYVSKNAKGLFVVMDLGGGTFDVSVIDSRYGSYIVMATDGLVVGGDNFDINVFRYLAKKANIQTFIFSAEDKNRFKLFCSKVKIEMAENYGKNMTFDLSSFGGPKDFVFKYSDYKKLMVLTFQETIELTKKIISKNVTEDDYKIVLVGGSTKNPYYRDWVASVFGAEHIIPMNYDPDRVVAQGAAYCAYLKETGEFEIQIQDVTKGLLVGVEEGRCHMIVHPNSVVPLSCTKMFSNYEYAKHIKIPLYQGDKMMQADNELIGELKYEYDEFKEPGEGTVYVTITVDVNGVISLTCEEPLGDAKTIKLDRLKTK